MLDDDLELVPDADGGFSPASTPSKNYVRSRPTEDNDVEPGSECTPVKKGRPPGNPFVWTGQKVKAAKLLVDAEWSVPRIAEEIKCHPETIQKWKKKPEFQAYMRKLLSAFEAHAMRSGIANKARRMAHLNYHFERLGQIIAERAERYRDTATGGGSGLIAIEVKLRKVDDRWEPIEEEVFDAALAREYRAVLQQAAEETGQLVSRSEISGPDGSPLGVSIGVLDDVARRVREAREKDEDSRIEGGGGTEVPDTE